MRLGAANGGGSNAPAASTSHCPRSVAVQGAVAEFHFERPPVRPIAGDLYIYLYSFVSESSRVPWDLRVCRFRPQSGVVVGITTTHSRTTGRPRRTVVIDNSRHWVHPPPPPPVRNIRAKSPFWINVVVLEVNKKPDENLCRASIAYVSRTSSTGWKRGEIAGSYGNCGVAWWGRVSDGQKN